MLEQRHEEVVDLHPWRYWRFSELTWTRSEQPDLSEPAWSKGLDQMSLPTYVSLQFYETYYPGCLVTCE